MTNIQQLTHTQLKRICAMYDHLQNDKFLSGKSYIVHKFKERLKESEAINLITGSYPNILIDSDMASSIIECSRYLKSKNEPRSENESRN